MHKGVVQFGQVNVGATVSAEVNQNDRRDIQKNHSATHLLHAALKSVLGDHVNQAGSLVEADRLRFDFSHFGPMTNDEIDQVERLVNEEIWKGIDVNIQEMDIASAKEMGAMALFGEKYGDVVRVVNMAPFSIELCGGIHVRNTSEIGLFKIVSESGTGAGVRRIEALTGKAAFLYLEDIQEKFNTMKSQLKVKSDDQVVDKLTQLQDEEKALLKQLEQRDKEITSLKWVILKIKLKKSMAIKYWLLKWMYQMRKQFARQWTILNLNYKIQLSFLQVMLMIKYRWLQLSLNL